jgi:transposase
VDACSDLASNSPGLESSQNHVHARKCGERALREWLAWASRSKLPPFVKAARTIRKHFDRILAYVRERLTNGIVEGINNKLRMIARRP